MLDPELALAALGFVILLVPVEVGHLQLVHPSASIQEHAEGPPTQDVQAKLDPTGPTSSIASAAAGKIVVSCAE
jgi:hypothetical protein